MTKERERRKRKYETEKRREERQATEPDRQEMPDNHFFKDSCLPVRISSPRSSSYSHPSFCTRTEIQGSHNVFPAQQDPDVSSSWTRLY